MKNFTVYFSYFQKLCSRKVSSLASILLIENLIIEEEIEMWWKIPYKVDIVAALPFLTSLWIPLENSVQTLLRHDTLAETVIKNLLCVESVKPFRGTGIFFPDSHPAFRKVSDPDQVLFLKHSFKIVKANTVFSKKCRSFKLLLLYFCILNINVLLVIEWNKLPISYHGPDQARKFRILCSSGSTALMINLELFIWRGVEDVGA